MRLQLALSLLSLSACVAQSPLPKRTLPQSVAQLPAASSGQGVLLVDVTDGPSQVSASGGAACTTPCALLLPLGPQPLTLKYRDANGGETENFTTALVSGEPRVLRRTFERTIVLKPARAWVAAGLSIASSVAFAAAAATLPFSGEMADKVGEGLAIGGASAFVLSLPLTIGTVRKVSGAEVQFLASESDRPQDPGQ